MNTGPTCQATSQSEFDRRLEQADLEALKSFSMAGENLMSQPPFHNVFFNSFVNSPGFSKRLRRPESGMLT